MNLAALDDLLRQTLADPAFDRDDRQLLAGFARDQRLTAADAAAVRQRAFAVARGGLAGRDPAAVLAWLEATLAALTPPPAAAGAPASAHFSPGIDCLSRIVSRFQGAKTAVDACVFTITDDRITRALLDAHHRGVKVRVIADNDKALDLGSDIQQIAAAGVLVKVDQTPFHMHHKFALFDEARLVNGSYNWTRGAADQNEENVIDTGDPVLIAAFRAAFDGLWAKL